MEGAEPVLRRRLQKAAHLAARMHEVAAAPFAHAHVLVGVLKERRAVKVGEPPGVAGKVHGHKVQNGADARLVQAVDEGHELVCRAKAARGREEPHGLVAPALVCRVLGEGEKLHVRVAAFFEVGDERLGELVVAVPQVGLFLAVLVLGLAPRAGVKLVDVERAVKAGAAALHPRVVAKAVGAEVAHDGAVAGAQVHAEAKGVAMVLVAAVAPVDAVLVRVTGAHVGHAHLKDVAVVGAFERYLARGRARGFGAAAEEKHHACRGRGKHPERCGAGERQGLVHGVRVRGFGRRDLRRVKVHAEVLVRVKAQAAIKLLHFHCARSFVPGAAAQRHALEGARPLGATEGEDRRAAVRISQAAR